MRLWITALCVAALVGCKSSPGATGATGSAGASVTSSVEPAGAHCAHGGVHFVTQSGDAYACNGAAGPAGSDDTGSQILAKLSPVDGAGSGLDADTVDGHPAADFLYSASSGVTLSGTTFGVDPAVVQQRIGGVCPTGQAVVSVGADGSVACGAPWQRTVLVSGTGSPTENGAALIAALAGITGASSTSPYLLKLEPGVYDLGTSSLPLKSFVDLEGSGQGVTSILGESTGAMVTASGLSGTVELRSLTLSNTASSSSVVSALSLSGGEVSLLHATIVATNTLSGGPLGTTAIGVASVSTASKLTVRGSNITAALASGNFVPPMAINTNVQNSELIVQGSELHAPTGIAVVINGNGSTGRVANTLIDGGAGTGGTATLTCVGAYDAEFVALGTDCR